MRMRDTFTALPAVQVLGIEDENWQQTCANTS